MAARSSSRPASGKRARRRPSDDAPAPKHPEAPPDLRAAGTPGRTAASTGRGRSGTTSGPASGKSREEGTGEPEPARQSGLSPLERPEAPGTAPGPSAGGGRIGGRTRPRYAALVLAAALGLVLLARSGPSGETSPSSTNHGSAGPEASATAAPSAPPASAVGGSDASARALFDPLGDAAIWALEGDARGLAITYSLDLPGDCPEHTAELLRSASALWVRLRPDERGRSCAGRPDRLYGRVETGPLERGRYLLGIEGGDPLELLLDADGRASIEIRANVTVLAPESGPEPLTSPTVEFGLAFEGTASEIDRADPASVNGADFRVTNGRIEGLSCVDAGFYCRITVAPRESGEVALALSETFAITDRAGAVLSRLGRETDGRTSSLRASVRWARP